MSSANTQWALVGWYWNAVPGSKVSRQRWKARMRPSLAAPSMTGMGACGKPEVCSITCSMVMTSLPLVPNSGMRSTTRAAGSMSPSPMSAHMAPATNALVAEKTM
jgi:hypothetical protein